MTDTTVRQARCTSCKRTVASDAQGLAFLERRGPGSRFATDTCRVCRYTQVAHERFTGRLMDSVGSGRWPRGVDPHEFDALSEGAEFDTFYCGCRGWE